MAEFYSANLAIEVKKGMRQKMQIGGWTHRAPIGYINRKESVEGRRIAYVEPDPNRAPLIRLAFEMYATGERTIEHILDEVTSRGLTMRPWRNRPTRPLSYNGLVWVLINKFYAGIVEWNGAEYPGRHQPLVDMETFNRVQELFAARTGREARHRHFLDGHLVCGVCGRRLSLQKSKGRYLYYFCLGQKDRRKPTGCRERYVAAADLERQVEELYAKIQLSPGMAQDLWAALEAELVEQQDRNAADRDLQTKRLTVREGQRRKLLEAYYADAIDVAMLREEQDRIGRETRQAEELLRSADAGLAEWQSVLDLAMRLATNCANAYRLADHRIQRQLNEAVFEEIVVRDGHVAEARYQALFGLFFCARVRTFRSGAGDGLRTRYLNLGNKAFRVRIRTSFMSSCVCFIRLYSVSLEFVSGGLRRAHGSCRRAGAAYGVRTSECQWPSPGVSDSQIMKPSFG